MPEVLQLLNGTIKNGFPIDDYKRFNNEELREFIKEHFDESVVKAYDSLRSYSNKADLGRYCLLHAIGGWYFTWAFVCTLPLN